MEIVFVAESVAPPLDDADFVVESFDEAKRHFVLRLAVGGDPIPVALDQRGELLEWLEPLPPEGGPPPVEELPRPRLAPILPELGELLLQDVRGVEPLVGGEQRREAAVLLGREILPVREQHVLLPLMYFRSGRLVSRLYSCFRTWSIASPKWRSTWNLS